MRDTEPFLDTQVSNSLQTKSRPRKTELPSTTLVKQNQTNTIINTKMQIFSTKQAIGSAIGSVRSRQGNFFRVPNMAMSKTKTLMKLSSACAGRARNFAPLFVTYYTTKRIYSYRKYQESQARKVDLTVDAGCT